MPLAISRWGRLALDQTPLYSSSVCGCFSVYSHGSLRMVLSTDWYLMRPANPPNKTRRCWRIPEKVQSSLRTVLFERNGMLLGRTTAPPPQVPALCRAVMCSRQGWYAVEAPMVLPRALLRLSTGPHPPRYELYRLVMASADPRARYKGPPRRWLLTPVAGPSGKQRAQQLAAPNRRFLPSVKRGQLPGSVSLTSTLCR